MDRRQSCTVFLGVLFAVVQCAACGGGGTARLAVYTTSIPNGFVNTPYYSTLQAVGGTAPFTWAQTSGGPMPPGVTLNSSGTFAGTPTQAGTFGPYVFVVTDSAGTTASSTSLGITIAASTLSVTTTSLPNGYVGTAYSGALAASGGSSPYSWSETTGGALPPGLLLASSGAITGTPTTAGTYGPYVFTVVDTKNTTAVSPSLMITITGTASAVCTPAGNEAALSSGNPYAFLVKGTDGRGNPIDIAGSFTPDGQGGISAAATDYNGFSNGPEPLQVNLAGSSYSFSSSAQGCLYLAFSGLASTDASVRREGTTAARLEPANAARTRKTVKPEVVAVPTSNVQFSFYLSGYDGTVYNTGRIIESDTSTSGTNASGFIHVQAPSTFTLASLQPNYAFGVDGWTATAPGTVRTAMAGAFTNTAGVISAGYADINAGGTASGEVTGGYGTLNSTIDTTTGRGTGSYFLITPTGRLTFDFAFYVLNGADLILLSTDLAQSNSTTPLLAGRALVSTVNYNAAALNGYYLLASEGLQSGIGTGNIAQIATLNATSAGTIPTATLYSNFAGTYLSNQYPGSSYSVEAASGRVSITGLETSPPVVYLTNLSADDGIAGFLVGTDPQASSGVIVTQTTAAPSYSAGSITGSYAASTAEDVDGLNGSFLGAFSFSGTGSYTVTPQTTGKVTNVPNLGSIVVNSDGSGNLDGGNFPLVTNGTVLYAIPNSGDPLLFVLTEGTITP